MDKVNGNYLTQGNKNFPLDCETLDYISQNRSMCELLGNIAGDKVILYGCGITNGNTQRAEGYVFLRTTDYPTGEVLRFEGGTVANGMYVKKSDTSVTANGYSYPKAYTTRSLAAGVGTEQYQWSDFTELSTNKALASALASLKSTVDSIVAEPLGIVKMWAGKTVPDGYHLCDGSELLVSDYPDLAAVLNHAFDTANDANGNAQTVTDATKNFRLPDLRGRFIVGYSGADDDYKKLGIFKDGTQSKDNGEKTHTLTAAESGVGKHTHDTTVSGGEHTHPISGTGSCEDDGNAGSCIETGTQEQYQLTFSATATGGSHTHSVINAETERAASSAHENRPPYYVLAYIMKLK